MSTTSTDRTSRIGDIAIKAPCVVASTAALTLSGNQTIDGVACVTGDRVLVKNQSNTVTNGIYVVDTGDWSRSTDCDGSYDLANGTLVKVNSGTVGSGFWYAAGTNPIIVGTSAQTWGQASTVLAVVSAFMQTMLDDATAAAARTTLGSTTVGDAVFIAATAAAARSAMSAAGSGLATASGLTQNTARMLGRTTASTGAVEEISVGAGLSLASGALSGAEPQIQSFSASVAASALTISAPQLRLDFRSSTLTSSTVTTVTGTPSNLVVSSGSTLGTTSAVQSRLAVLALNNAGTIELAVVNISGGTDLTETGVISTTAEGGAGAADSATVVYSTTARSNVAYRVIGYIESTQATAGTWATAPSTLQGAGGQALTAMSSIGYGQTWQNVSGSRASATNYTNTTGRPIMVSIAASGVGSGTALTVSGIVVAQNVNGGATSGNWGVSAIVPPGAVYSAVVTGAIATWAELR
jgi:hypothetical protein